MKKVQALAADATLFWWLGEFLAEKHPEVDVPRKMNEHELKCRETAFLRRAKAALASTMRDLLRPIGVRDISFNPLGRDGGQGSDCTEIRRSRPHARVLVQHEGKA